MNSSNEFAKTSPTGEQSLLHQTVRSDDHITELVRLALKATGYEQLMTLGVSCQQGRVTLEGCVPSYYLKQVAQSALNAVEGIRAIDNALTVVSAR